MEKRNNLRERFVSATTELSAIMADTVSGKITPSAANRKTKLVSNSVAEAIRAAHPAEGKTLTAPGRKPKRSRAAKK